MKIPNGTLITVRNALVAPNIVDIMLDFASPLMGAPGHQTIWILYTAVGMYFCYGLVSIFRPRFGAAQ